MSGAVNTAATYIIYLLLLSVAPYRVSYTLSYVSGIVLAYWLNRVFVFKSHRGAMSVLILPLIYVGQYVLGMTILWLWIDKAGLSQRLGPIVVVLVTIPVTFIFTRAVFWVRKS